MMSRQKYTRAGFTMIELLVVIAIIGILTSIVLSSLNNARESADDTAIKSNLSTIRSEAEMYYDGNSLEYATSTVNDDCADAGSLFADTNISAAITAAEARSSGAASCYASPDAWAISVPLKSNPAIHWCVDNSSVAVEQGSEVSTTICG